RASRDGRTAGDDLARLVAAADDGDLAGPRGQEWAHLLRLLHQRDAVAVEELGETEIHQLGEALRAIGVHVMDGEPAAVLVDEDERRAGGACRHAEAAGHALDEARLPRPELPD